MMPTQEEDEEVKKPVATYYTPPPVSRVDMIRPTTIPMSRPPTPGIVRSQGYGLHALLTAAALDADGRQEDVPVAVMTLSRMVPFTATTNPLQRFMVHKDIRPQVERFKSATLASPKAKHILLPKKKKPLSSTTHRPEPSPAAPRDIKAQHAWMSVHRTPAPIPAFRTRHAMAAPSGGFYKCL